MPPNFSPEACLPYMPATSEQLAKTFNIDKSMVESVLGESNQFIIVDAAQDRIKFDASERGREYMRMNGIFSIQTAGPTTLEVRYFEDWGIPDPIGWAVEGLIPDRGITIFQGPPKCGKSSFVTYLLTRALKKLPLFPETIGFQCSIRPPALVFDLENGHAIFYERVQEMGGVPEKSLLTFNFGGSIDLMNPDHCQWLLDLVNKHNPGIIVIDTLRRAHRGLENDSSTTNDIYNDLLRKISETRPVIIIAHTRKPGNWKSQEPEELIYSARGSLDIPGIAAAVIHMTHKRQSSEFGIKCVAMRHAPEPPDFSVSILEEKGNPMMYSFNGYSRVNEIEGSAAAREFLQWIIENSKIGEEWRWTDLKNGFIGLGYTSRSFSDVMKRSSIKAVLTKQGEGRNARYIYQPE